MGTKEFAQFIAVGYILWWSPNRFVANYETRCRELEEKVRELEMKQAQASSSADFCQVEICSIPSQRFGYSFFLSLRK